MVKKLNFYKSASKGFTLLEMLIVVTIIGVLAAVVIPRFSVSTAQAKKNSNSSLMQTINSQLELFYFTEGQYPAAMTNEGWTGTATNYTDYWPDGVPVNDVYEKAWTYSNSTGRVSSTTQ
tara:strand:+ start:23 stop:382 length:360 start_codon:yes stop_codon:yes gene_type:complete